MDRSGGASTSSRSFWVLPDEAAKPEAGAKPLAGKRKAAKAFVEDKENVAPQTALAAAGKLGAGSGKAATPLRKPLQDVTHLFARKEGGKVTGLRSMR